MRRENVSRLLLYAVGAALAGASVGLTLLLWDLFDISPFMLSFAAVVLSAWYGGARSSITTVVVSAVGIDYFLLEPQLDLSLSPRDLVTLVLFIGVALLVIWIELRRRAGAQALREARDELRIILDGVADGITVQTEDGQTIYANAAAAALAGYPDPAALIGTIAADRDRHYRVLDERGEPIPESERPRSKVFTTGERTSRTVQILFKATGEERWVHIKTAPIFDERRRAKIAVNILQDVTQRTVDERSLQQLHEYAEAQRRRLDSVVNNLPGMVYESVVDPETGARRNIFISPYAEKMFGYDLARLQNDPDMWQTLIHPDDIPRMMEEIGRQMAAGNAARAEYRAVKADGSIIYCESRFIEIRDEHGKPLGATGLVLDITEQKQAEAASEQYAEELRRSNEELEQFAYVASHDLQEPLRMITSYLQLIEQRYGNRLDGDALEFIGFAVDGAIRMKTLINDLLTYSRVQRARLELTTVSMEDVLDQVKQNLHLVIQESEAEITNDALPAITAFEGQMIQLMQNLIGNALKFRREGPPKIHVSAEVDKATWTFSVRDNGIGIESEYMERIFVIFQRLHGRDQHPGTGIGLAVCKKIVERHNGRIWVESTPGVGSVFHFTIPVNIRKAIV